MKTKTITVLAVLSLIIVSCSAVDKLLTFNIAQSATFTINSTLPINTPIDIATPDVTTNSSQTFKNNNTSADLVKDVKLTQLKLTAIDPANQDFSFLKSVHIYISTTSSDEIELAYADNISSTSNTLDLTCTTQKLDKYIKADSYKLRTSVTTQKVTSSNVTVRADMNFKITADPLKAL